MSGCERLLQAFTDWAAGIAGLKPGDVRPFCCFLGANGASAPMTSLADNPLHPRRIAISGSGVMRVLFPAIH